MIWKDSMIASIIIRSAEFEYCVPPMFYGGPKMVSLLFVRAGVFTMSANSHKMFISRNV